MNSIEELKESYRGLVFAMHWILRAILINNIVFFFFLFHPEMINFDIKSIEFFWVLGISISVLAMFFLMGDQFYSMIEFNKKIDLEKLKEFIIKPNKTRNLISWILMLSNIVLMIYNGNWVWILFTSSLILGLSIQIYYGKKTFNELKRRENEQE